MKVKPEQPEHIKHAIMLGNEEERARAEAAGGARQPAEGPEPPPGKAPLRTIDDWEALPQKEQLARMNEVDQLLAEGQR